MKRSIDKLADDITDKAKKVARMDLVEPTEVDEPMPHVPLEVGFFDDGSSTDGMSSDDFNENVCPNCFYSWEDSE